MNDFVQSLRTLRKHPSQSLLIFSIIAVGVGASSAFYSVSDALLLHPLPFDAGGRLMDVEQRLEPSGAPLMNSHQNLIELDAQSRMLDGIAVYKAASGIITANGRPEPAEGMAVDRYFFPVIGVAPILGRGFTDEDEKDGMPCTMVLSHAFWQRHFAGDPSILGKKNILLDKRLCAVIGVTPQSFFFPFNELTTSNEDFWMPLQDQSSLRGDYDKHGLAKLKQGVFLQQAQAEASLIARHISQADKSRESHLLVLRPYREVIVADYLPMLRLLGCILACVLLVVSINVASLLLVEMMRSHKEFAIRLALGGTSWRIVGVFLIRVLNLTLAGGLAGIVLAWALVNLTRKLLPDGFPDADQITLNVRVVWFAAGVALATGFVSGLWPALTAIRRLQRHSLAGAGHSVGVTSLPKSRSYLVVLQLGFSSAFLVVTGLLGLSLYRLSQVDPGMQLDHRMVVMVHPADSALKTPEALRMFFSRVGGRLLATPGVRGVSVSSDAPLGAHGTRDFRIKDITPPRDSREWIAESNAVDANYFRELGIAVLSGRSFTGQDRSDGKPVAIVNRLFAKRFFGGKSPLGKQICIPSGDGCIWREIVGVVADVRDSRIDISPEAAYFLPFSQAPKEFLSNATFTLWTGIAPGAVWKSVQEHMADWAPSTVPTVSLTLEEMRARQTIAPLARVWILAAIAALALLLAAMGVYGVIAGIVEQRRREIGIRVAVGASRHNIASLFLRKMSLMLGPGLLIGIAGAAMLVRYITSLLFETSPIDILAYCGAALVVGSVAVIATSLPVRRALQENPGEIMRAE